jgi:AraC family transcriptional regulator
VLKEPELESDQQYAQRQVRQFKTDGLSQIVASGLGDSKLLVSRVRRDTPGHGFATPTRPDSVFSVLVQLRPQERRELFLNDRLVHQGSFRERTVSVVDHWQSPKANLLSAFDTVIFTVPQSALNEVAYEQGVKPALTLICENEGRLDDTVWSLAQSLLPALERPDEVGSMYAERVLLASTTYFGCSR